MKYIKINIYVKTVGMLLALSALPMGAVHATSTNATLNGFQGVNPEFSSEKDVYYWMLAELADAVSNINTEVAPDDTEKKNDPVFAFDAAKWKNYGISLRMRLAMRLSEADPAKAKSEFEAAVAQGSGIKTVDGTAAVQEYDGWSDWSGPMSRSWDITCKGRFNLSWFEVRPALGA